MIRTLKNLYHLIVAIIANLWYGFPSREITVIGVTGTDGKTTTTSLIFHILQQAGKKVSMVSTVYAKVGGKEYDTGFHVSTPHSFTVQRFLRESVRNGDEFFIMESTSHALDQNRVWGVRFKVGVLTNITHEHLDYHGNYDNYVKAKTKLLRAAETVIVNADDGSYSRVQKILDGNVLSYGLQHGEIKMDISEKLHVKLPEFNKYNFLAAYCACREAGIEDNIIFEAMKTFPLPPGRMEVIQEHPFTVIVDFAHTPNSTKVALNAVHDTYLPKNGRLIHIFGCAAKRDEAKRPLMGEESGKRADLVILTEEDYRDEDPVAISEAIAVGLQKVRFKYCEPDDFGIRDKYYTILTNRKEAIEKAIAIAKPGDVIIATGKGHEKSLCRGNTEYPWDEQKAFRDALRIIQSKDVQS